MKSFLFVSVLLVSLSSGHLAADVKVSLSVEPTHVLPGIAPSIHVTVTNDGPADATLPPKLLLRVIPAKSPAFIAEWGAGQEHRFSNARFPGESRPGVAAHSTHDFVFTSYSLDRVPGWFYDARLNAPGTYRLQLLLFDRLAETAVFQADPLSIETALPVSAISAEAVLTIDTPRGADAELWGRLQRIAARHGMSNWSPVLWGDAGWRDFVRDAADDNPTSPYAAYVIRDYAETSAGERLAPEERLAKAERVLKVQPATAVREDIQLFIAEMEVRIAEHAASQPNPDLRRAIFYYDRARGDLQALERTARDPAIRERSREQREHLPATADVSQRN